MFIILLWGRRSSSTHFVIWHSYFQKKSRLDKPKPGSRGSLLQSLHKTCRSDFDLSVCQCALFATTFSLSVGKDKELIHNPQQMLIYWGHTHAAISHHQTVSLWEPMSLYFLRATVPIENPHTLFSDLLYFVYDLFASIACRISMHSTLGVITSHPVSSPWLHLSSFHLFSMWYFLSHLLLVVPIWSLLSSSLSASLSVRAHMLTLWRVTRPHYFFKVVILRVITDLWFIVKFICNRPS